MNVPAKAMKFVIESSRIAPVPATDITSIIGRDSTTIDNYAKNNEAEDCNDLDEGERELDLTIAEHSKDLDGAEEDQEDSDPDRDVNVSPPILDGDGSGGQLEG